jgi:hypothetical protein
VPPSLTLGVRRYKWSRCTTTDGKVGRLASPRMDLDVPCVRRRVIATAEGSTAQHTLFFFFFLLLPARTCRKTLPGERTTAPEPGPINLGSEGLQLQHDLATNDEGHGTAALLRKRGQCPWEELAFLQVGTNRRRVDARTRRGSGA